MAALCSFAVSAKAQHYNEILLFIEVGKTIDDASTILYLHFDSDGNMYKESMSKSTAQNKYAKGVLEEYGVNQSHEIKRDYSIESNKYAVYSKDFYTQTYEIIGYNHSYSPYTLPTAQCGYVNKYASTDCYGIEYGDSGLVKWTQWKGESKIGHKTYYKRIQPSDLARKAPNYDFLN